MKQVLTNYFFYSKNERNGIIALLSLCVLAFILNVWSSSRVLSDESADFSEFETALADFRPTIDASFESYNPSAAPQSQGSLFNFNPNTASLEMLVALGLRPKLAQTIVNYRNKGGKFRKKEDLQRIYGLTPADYQRLAPFVVLDDVADAQAWNWDQWDAAAAPQNTPLSMQPFDPNSASEEQLLGLGLDKKSVKNLLKFREKGGKFFKKEDMKKIYGMSEIDFLRLEPYIQISENQKTTHATPFAQANMPQNNIASKGNLNTIDLNTANQDDLLQLRGIGRTFAARILEYRDKLGGFASTDQLKEVHGIPDSTHRAIVQFLTLSPKIRTIHVNKAGTNELTHPYVTRKQVEIILRFRTNHGDFRNLEDLKKTGVFSSENIEKLKPYLVFD